MSRISTTTVTRTGSLTLNPSGNTGSTNLTISTNYPVSNAYANSSSTSYARWTIGRRTTGSIYLTFSSPSIPSNATITNVSCVAKLYGSSNVTTRTIQIYSNTTAKGTSSQYGTSQGTVSIDGGTSWTISELNNLRLYISGTIGNNSNQYLYFYGADLTIEYTYPEEVQTTEYQISVTNNSSATVSPTGTNNWVAEGGSQTITLTNVSNANTISVVDNNTNVTNQIVHTSGTTYTYTISNISADHTIVVKNAQTYNVNVSIDSSATGLVSSSNSGNNTAYEGHDFEVDISCDDISVISVYDNNADVTSEVEELNAVSESLTFTPSEYDERESSFASIYDGNESTPIGQNSNASNRICVYSNKGASAESKLVYKFDCSLVPSNATITNVSCTVKCSCYSSNPGTYFATYTVQLYCGDVAKGSSSNIPGGGGSPSGTTSISGGSWAREELDDICLVERVVRVASGTNATADASFNLWGATLTIQYTTPSGYKYTIKNVQAAHNIVLAEAPHNVISGTSNLSGASFSNLPQKFYVSGRDFTVYITGITNDKSFKLYDNNVDVTSSVDLYDYSYVIQNITQDHALRIDEATKHNITGSTSLSGVSFQNVPSTAYDTDDFVAKISGVTNIKSVKLLDNNVNVTNLIGYYTGSKTFVPAEYEGGTFTSSNTGNGLYGSDHTGNYASFTLSSSSQYGIYGFDISIPSNVIIKSITCTVRAYVTGTASSRFVQLYSGNTPKGTANTIPTTNGTFTLDCGDWTADELNNAKLRFEGLNSSTYSINFYGATITIECDECTYKISNVQEAHNLMIEENPNYAVTGIANFGTGFSGLSNKVYEGESIVVTLLGITNPLSFKLYDNNVDVTSQVNTANWEYTLTNVQAAHELRLEEATYYNVSGNSNFTGVSFSGLPSKVYDGDTLAFRLTGITNEYSFYLFDNGGDATASVDVANNYQVIYNNVHESHTFEIREKPHYSVTTNSSFSGVTISGGSNKVYVGQEVTIIISGATNIHSLYLEDNDVDVSQYIVESGNTFTYTILGVVEDHVIVLSEADHHTVTASSNHATAGISVSPATMYPGEGFVAEITIPDGTNPYSIKLLDNNEDVTNYIEYSNAEASTYEVETASGASYGFTLNTSTGYYTSDNAGENKSAAVCVVTFNLAVESRIIFKFINYAEEAYDFGVFGNVDSALSNDYYAAGSGGATITDSNYKLACNTSTYNSGSEQTLVYDNVPVGEHYIYVKYSKDDATASNNDTLQFKIDSIEDLEENVSSIRYSRSSVSEDHILLLTTEQICNITTSNSQYPSASLSVNNASPYRYEPITITLNVSNISLVTVTVTALSTTKAITGKFEEVSNGVYEATYIPKGDTNIVVKQHVDYTVTATDTATNGTLSPTGTLTIEAGYDAEYKVTSDYFNRIYLKDDNVIVNDKFVYNQLQDGSITLYIDSSSNASSSGYTNFTTSSSYPISNAGDSSNDTSNYFRLRSNTSNGQHEAWLEFDTDSLSNVPSNINLSVTCKIAFRVSNTTYISALSVQLYSGNAAKGSATTTRTTTTTVYTLNIGNWTLEELQNARIRVTATHNNSTSNGDVRIYGCDLTVSWHEDEHYSYTIENISKDHTILLQDRPTYQVTASSAVSGSTISPASQTIYEDNPATVTVSTDELFRLKLLDNGSKVTLMPSGDDYTYTIDSVMEAHTLLLDRLLSPYLKVNGSWASYSRLFKKINGIWVEQVTMEGVFGDGKVYMLDN